MVGKARIKLEFVVIVETESHLGGFGRPGTNYVNQADLKFRGSPCFCLLSARFKGWTTTLDFGVGKSDTMLHTWVRT